MVRRLSIAVVVTLVVITIAALLPLSELKFNYNIESFFSTTDPDVSYYEEYTKSFEKDNDFLLIGIKSNSSIFNYDFLQKIDSLTKKIEDLRQIISLQSATNLSRYIKSPMGFIPVPILHFDKPERYKTDSAYIYNNPDLISSFFSPDAKSLTILVKKDSIKDKEYNDILLSEIDSLVKQYNFVEYHFGGSIKTQNYYVGRLNHDIIVLSLTAILILIVFLWITFRSFWGIWLPGIVLLISLILIAAIMQLTDNHIDMLTTMLPALIFVIGISDGIHIISKYIEELRKGEEKLQAIKTMLKEIGLATFLTSFTTAIGFFSLVVLDIIPLQRFGIISGMGILLTYLISIFIIPAVFVLRPVPDISKNNIKDSFWSKYLNKTFLYIIKHKGSIIIISIVITAFFALGITKIVVNNSFLDDLSSASSLKKDLDFFENNFSGIRPVEIGIDIMSDSLSIYNLEVLSELDKIDNYLRNTYKVGFIVSPLSIIKNINQSIHGGKYDYYRIPNDEKELASIKSNIESLHKPDIFKSFVDKTGKRIRISGKIYDLGSVIISSKNKAFYDFVNSKGEFKIFKIKITGAAQLLDNTNRDISTKLLKGLGIAFIIIGLIIGLLFRSWRLVSISIIVNTIPLIVIAGLMGFTGIHLRVSTALIFSIVFGIAVDDTIHFLSKLKLELNNGKSLIIALRRTYLTTGKAIIITSLILTSGFLTFTISEFQSTVIIGLNIFVALLFALTADMLLLPVMLILFYKHKAIDTESLRHRLKVKLFSLFNNDTDRRSL